MVISSSYLNSIKTIAPLTCYVSLNKSSEILLYTFADCILSSVLCLRNFIGSQFIVLSCISGVDFLHLRNRFSICYEFLSLSLNTRVRLKCSLNEVSPATSIVSIFPNADWFEREIWDLFGVFFKRHPDLRRILTDYGFEGFPMRKDFPLSGFIETQYSPTQRGVVATTLELSQDYRLYNFVGN